MEPEFITDQADVRLHERYVPDDAAQHSDLLHISLCKALHELTRLRTRLALLEKAIEWACENQGRFSNMSGSTKPNSMFVAELRHQAKGGK